LQPDGLVNYTCPMKKRMHPKVRTGLILSAAVKLAEKAPGGYRALSRDQIAESAGVSPGLVSFYLGTMDAVRRSIMRAAIAEKNLKVIAQGLGAGDTYAKKAPPELKAAAAAALLAG
jgi:AcrR family transcriptional regulator